MGGPGNRIAGVYWIFGVPLLFLLACDGGSTKPTPDADPADTDAPPTAPTGDDDDDDDLPGDDDDDIPLPTGDCAADPDLEVVTFTATAGLPFTMVELAVTLSKPATVAVQCTSDTEADEILFAESTTEGEEHTLRLEGLLPLSTYTCTAAPTCPTMALPAASLAYATTTPPSDLRTLTVVEDPVLSA